jgi:hypothetical protein
MMEEVGVQFHNKFFMDIFIIETWLIWKQRIKEANLQALRMNDKKKLAFQDLVQLYS